MSGSHNLPSDFKAVVLTALRAEYAAVRRLLDPDSIREIRHEQGTLYERGHFSGSHGRWKIAVAEIGPGNDTAAFELERALATFRPDVALFVGVAGGIKDVAIGDVVFATKVYGYESGKAQVEFLPRPQVTRSSYGLEQRARFEGRRLDWLDRAPALPDNMRPRAIVAPMAAGEKVIADTRSATYEFLRREYGDATAVEMEGRGFLEASHGNRGVETAVVRGISDLIDEKEQSDAAGYQELAAAHAAAFAFQILAEHDPTYSTSDDVGGLASKPVKYAIVVAGTYDEDGLAMAKAIFEVLRTKASDATMVLREVRAGSLVIHISGSFAGYQKLVLLFRARQLPSELQRTIVRIDFFGSEEHETPQAVTWKAQESESDEWHSIAEELYGVARRIIGRKGYAADIVAEDVVNDAIVRYLASGEVVASSDQLIDRLKVEIKRIVSNRIGAFRRDADRRADTDPADLELADRDASNEERAIANDLTERARESLSSQTLRKLFDLILSGYTSATELSSLLGLPFGEISRLRRRLRVELTRWAGGIDSRKP